MLDPLCPAHGPRHRNGARSIVAAAAAAATAAVVLAGCSSSGGKAPAAGNFASAASGAAGSTVTASAPTLAPVASGSQAAPGSSPASASGSAADPATKAAVSTAYESFFSPNTAPSVAVAELQNGAQFTSSLAALAKTAKQQNTSVTVSAVSVAGPVATVTFTLYGGNQAPLLPDTHGYAVLVNGKWQVAAQTFCALVSLQGPVPAACKDPKNTALPS